MLDGSQSYRLIGYNVQQLNQIFQQLYGPVFYIGTFTNGQVIYAFEKLKCFARVKQALPKSLRNFFINDLDIIGNFGHSLVLKSSEFWYGKLLKDLVELLDIIPDKSVRLATIKHYISPSSFPEGLKLADSTLFLRVMKEVADLETIQCFFHITRKEFYPDLLISFMHCNIEEHPDFLLISKSLSSLFEVHLKNDILKFLLFPGAKISSVHEREIIYNMNQRILVQLREPYYRYLRFINIFKFGSLHKISLLNRRELLVFFLYIASLKDKLMSVKLISLFWDRDDAISELNGISQNFDWENSLALLALNPVEYLQRGVEQLIGNADFNFFLCNCADFDKTEMRDLFENAFFNLLDGLVEANPEQLSPDQSRFVILGIRLASAWNNTETLTKLGEFSFSRGFDKENIYSLIPIKSAIWSGPLAAVFVRHIGSKERELFIRIIASAIFRNDKVVLQLLEHKIDWSLEFDLLEYGRLSFSPIYLERIASLLKDGKIAPDDIERINEQFCRSYCDDFGDALAGLRLKPEMGFIEFCARFFIANREGQTALAPHIALAVFGLGHIFDDSNSHLRSVALVVYLCLILCAILGQWRVLCQNFSLHLSIWLMR